MQRKCYIQTVPRSTVTGIGTYSTCKHTLQLYLTCTGRHYHIITITRKLKIKKCTPWVSGEQKKMKKGCVMALTFMTIILLLLSPRTDAYCIRKGQCPKNKDSASIFNNLGQIMDDPICGTKHKCETNKQCGIRSRNGGVWCTTNECDLFKTGRLWRCSADGRVNANERNCK